MRLDEAREIVEVWGKHLELSGDKLFALFAGGIPESLLPFSADKIETALNVLAKHHHDLGESETSNMIKDTFRHLVLYCDDEEALRAAAWKFGDLEVRTSIVAKLGKGEFGRSASPRPATRTGKKSWLEIGRVKNSDWFQKLPELEKRSIIATVEEETHESAVKVRSVLTFTFMTAIYATAGALWGMTFPGVFWVIFITVASIGVAFGVLSGLVIASQKTPKGAADMQAVAGGFPGGLGLIIAGAGLVGWLARTVLFR